MKELLVYCPTNESPAIYKFLDSLDAKLRKKLVKQLLRLPDIPLCYMKEPHIKHFSIEKYSQLYEVREKNRILVRVIYTICDNGDILLLEAFIKRHKRNTMQALETSLKMLTEIEHNLTSPVKFLVKEEWL